jgi:hypothetical protein
MTRDITAQDLSHVSDEQLQAELKLRGEKRQREELGRRRGHCEEVEKNVDALLAVARHVFAACSDDTIRNRSFECPRCFLLEVKRHRMMDDDYELRLEVVNDPLLDPDNPQRRGEW